MEYPVVPISIAMKEVLWRAEHHRGLSSRDIISINTAKNFLSQAYDTAQELKSGIIRDNLDCYKRVARALGFSNGGSYVVQMRQLEQLQQQLSAVCQRRPINLKDLTSLFSNLLEDFHRTAK